MAHTKEPSAFQNPLIRWVDDRLPIFTMMAKEYGVFPTPRNFNYLWNFGALALVMLVIMIITGLPFFYRSIAINEQSGNAGGLPQWPSKSLVLIGFTMLLVQGLSELIKRIAVMRDLIPDPHASQVHALEAEVEHIVEAIEKR